MVPTAPSTSALSRTHDKELAANFILSQWHFVRAARASWTPGDALPPVQARTVSLFMTEPSSGLPVYREAAALQALLLTPGQEALSAFLQIAWYRSRAASAGLAEAT